MAIPKGYQTNLNTIIEAAKADRLAILDCTDKATGKQVIALIALGEGPEGYDLIPLAKMFDGNPYEEIDPPDLEQPDPHPLPKPKSRRRTK